MPKQPAAAWFSEKCSQEHSRAVDNLSDDLATSNLAARPWDIAVGSPNLQPVAWGMCGSNDLVVHWFTRERFSSNSHRSTPRAACTWLTLTSCTAQPAALSS